ncbi:hypothetical protein PG990_000863 [Apiospora arundinis]
MDFDWNSHFDEIRALFLVDRKPLKHIQALFKRKYGSDQKRASQKQWVKQLGRWKLKKNLSEKDWKYVAHVIKRRKAKSKESLVLVSGIQVSPERISTGWRNHSFALSRPSYHTSPSPEPPSDVVVSVSTPTSFTWERDLPWLHFQSKLNEYFMPEEFPNSHNERVYQITHGQGQGYFQAILEFIVFALSNNVLIAFLDSMRDYDPCVIGLLEMYRKTGFPFRELLSTTDRTLQAVADEAFASVVRMGRLDFLKEFVANGLDLKTRINKPIVASVYQQRLVSPIEVAMLNKHAEMANFLQLHDDSLDETDLVAVPIDLGCLDAISTSLANLQLTDEPKLIAWLDDERCNEKAAAMVLEKLWSMETHTPLEWPGLALVYAIRFNQHAHTENFLSCGERLLRTRSFSGASTFDQADSRHVPPLYEAAHKPDNVTFERLLKMIPCNSTSWSLILSAALQVAASTGNLFAMELLIERGVDLNFEVRVDNDGLLFHHIEILEQTTLIEAMEKSQIGAIERLVRAGAEISTHTVEVAAIYGLFSTLQGLLDYNLDITPLMLIDIVEEDSLQPSSSVDFCILPWTEPGTDIGTTALGVSILMGKTEMLQHLRESNSLRYDSYALAAAVFVAGYRNDRIMFEYLLDLRVKAVRDSECNAFRSINELTACFIAISCQDIKTLRLLKESGFFETPDSYLDPVGSAWFLWQDSYDTYDNKIGGRYNGRRWVGGTVTFIKEAIANGAWSFLGLALVVGAERGTMEFLLQNLPKPNRIDLFIALRYDPDPQLTFHLLNMIEDINGEEQPTIHKLLQPAIECGMSCVISRLLEMGANLNAHFPRFGSHDALPRNALQLACEIGNPGVVEMIMEAGADVNFPAAHDSGTTALQVAAIWGHIRIARRLIDYGADCNAPPAAKNGRTALEGAAEHGRLDMIALLLMNGTHTQGTSSIQYFRAIKFATREAHYTAANLLRDHRPWDEEDQNMFSQSCISDLHHGRGPCRCIKSDDSASETYGSDIMGDDPPEPVLQLGVIDGHAISGLQLQVAPEDRFAFSIDNTEYDLDLSMFGQQPDLLDELTGEADNFPCLCSAAASAEEYATGGVNQSTTESVAGDVREQTHTVEDSAAGWQVRPGTSVQKAGGIVGGEEAESDDWIDD